MGIELGWSCAIIHCDPSKLENYRLLSMVGATMRNIIFTSINVLVILAIMLSYFLFSWEDFFGESSGTMYSIILFVTMMFFILLRAYFERNGVLIRRKDP